MPTTLIGLIDASVSIKGTSSLHMAKIQPLILFLVGINHGNLKNRLGAYHAPLVTFLDFNMLRTLPEGQVRNGFAGKRRIYHNTE